MQIIVPIFCAALIFFVLENMRELRTFRVKKYNILSRKLNGISEKRILFLSDLHNYSYGKENQRLLQAIRRAEPDLILIGGDMIVRKNGTSYEKTVQFLQKLPEICPVYLANGNHEQKLKEWPDKYIQSYEDYKEQLIKSGVVFLENETVQVQLDRSVIRITGLEIPMDAYQRFGRYPLEMAELEERIGRTNSCYQILLAHNPSYVRPYQEWGADLILCGHLHGGIVGIPGIGGIIAPNFRLFPRYSAGKYRRKEAVIVVSRGLGTHSIPVRFLNPAELILLELSGTERNE